MNYDVAPPLSKLVLNQTFFSISEIELTNSSLNVSSTSCTPDQ